MPISRSLLFAGSLGLLAACHEQSSTSISSTSLPSGRRCYAHFSTDDTIQISLVAIHPSVVGYLKFNAGSDRNEGPFQGKMHGDTLLADYWLLIEGVRSPVAAPIAFLRRGNEYIEGFGDLAEHEGKFTFKSSRTIHFDTSRILRQADCLIFPATYSSKYCGSKLVAPAD